MILKKVTISDRNQWERLLLSYFLLLMIYRIYSSAMLVYAHGQPIRTPDLDYTFWLSHLIGFPDMIIQHYWLCFLIDVGVIGCSVFALFNKRKRTAWVAALLVLFFLQRITLESFSASHTKSIVCIFVALFPLCFKSEVRFGLMQEAARYFLLYILLFSAWNKWANGALLTAGNFVNVLINQHSDLAIYAPQHICYQTAQWLITHPGFANAAYWLLFLTQASFIIGVFTRRADQWLFIALIAFAITTYLVMRIYNFDLLVLGWVLLYVPKKSN